MTAEVWSYSKLKTLKCSPQVQYVIILVIVADPNLIEKEMTQIEMPNFHCPKLSQSELTQ